MALITPEPLAAAWQGVLTGALRRPIDPRALALMVQRTSRKYLGEDVDLARADELAARALFFFPRDVQKPALAVRELARAGALPGRALRVLDAGAGLGATSLGVLLALADEARAGTAVPTVASITALDRDAEALGLLRRIAEGAERAGLLPAPLPSITTRVEDFTDPSAFGDAPAGGYELILVGLALVEVTRAAGDERTRGARIAEQLAALIQRAPLAPDGVVVVLEPATREETRALHHARAALLERGVSVFAPCTHAGACPMLERERDWCHEDLAVDLPAWVAGTAREAGLRWQGLSFSYLVLRRDASRSVRGLVRDDGGWVPVRIVSQPRESKGKTEAFACGPFPGPTRGPRVMQLEREAKRAGEGAVLLQELRRGDVVGVAPEAAERASAGKPVRLGVEDVRRG